MSTFYLFVWPRYYIYFHKIDLGGPKVANHGQISRVLSKDVKFSQPARLYQGSHTFLSSLKKHKCI